MFKRMSCGLISEGEVMANDLSGTKTEKNLLRAFASESQVRSKYVYFAEKARIEGYDQVAAIFEETAAHEVEHAKMWFKLLNGNDTPTTEENLKTAIDGEKDETDIIYPQMAQEAMEEGFINIATLFEQVGEIEKDHEERFMKVLDNMAALKNTTSVHICKNCGHMVEDLSVRKMKY